MRQPALRHSHCLAHPIRPPMIRSLVIRSLGIVPPISCTCGGVCLIARTMLLQPSGSHLIQIVQKLRKKSHWYLMTRGVRSGAKLCCAYISSTGPSQAAPCGYHCRRRSSSRSSGWPYKDRGPLAVPCGSLPPRPAPHQHDGRAAGAPIPRAGGPVHGAHLRLPQGGPQARGCPTDASNCVDS